MVSHDYTKEVGLPSGQKKVSKPVAAILLAVLVAGAWYTIDTLALRPPHHTAVQVEATSRR